MAQRRVTFSTAPGPTSNDAEFAAYHDLYAPVADVVRLDADFSVAVEAHRLGEILAFDRKLRSVSHARSPKRAARNGFDHFTVQLTLRGAFRIATAQGERDVEPGALALVDMTQWMRTDAKDAEILTLSVPREHIDAAGEAGRLHGAVPPPDRAVLLKDFVLSCLRNETLLTPADLPRIERVTTDLLALALSDRSLPEQAQPQAAADIVCRSRAKAFIDRHLGVTPEELARAVGRSRSGLYRAFEPVGGVAAFIQARRLARLQRLLSRADDARRISEMIFDCGFASDSHATRLFKARFGLTPRAYRATRLDALAARDPALGSASEVFADWWASLR